MDTILASLIKSEIINFRSMHLNRIVELHCFIPNNIANSSHVSLLLINDGQDMPLMKFDQILNQLYYNQEISPVFCVAISANKDRLQEYGTVNRKDYRGRGSKAGLYTKFILDELLPFIKLKYSVAGFCETAFAGFSLGALSALDIVWNHPDIFSKVGVFSGSLWWRSVDQDDPNYNDDLHRIMHQEIRHGKFHPALKFFFQCGSLDELEDRNNNGIIDSIDDTLDLMQELKIKGYSPQHICYLELENGKHDVPTWGLAMPEFIKWGWGMN